MAGLGLPVSLVRYEKEMAKKRKEIYFWTDHLSWNEGIHRRILELGALMVFIMRDPRDAMASLYRSIIVRVRAERHLLKDLQGMTREELIDAIIEGRIGNSMGAGVYKRFWLPWRDQKYCMITKFERLIGSKGGGSDSVQKRELDAILEWIDFKRKEIVPDKLFSTTANTYVEGGKIGVWKKYFSEKNIETFERCAGNLLEDMGYTDNKER